VDDHAVVDDQVAERGDDRVLGGTVGVAVVGDAAEKPITLDMACGR